MSMFFSTLFKNNKLLILLFIVLIFSTVSRVLLFNDIYNSNPQSIEINDTVRYESPALNLLHNGSLAIDPYSINTSSLSTTPGYSLFIAGIYTLLGEDRYPLVIAQILASSLTILIIFFIAEKLWTRPIALIASTLMAVEPLQILYSQIIISETLFTLFITFSVLSIIYLFSSNNKNCQYKWALILGFSITCATMIKPISYYLVVVIIMSLALSKKQLGYEWKNLAQVLMLIMLPAIFIYGTWQVRNGMLTGVFEINDAKSETLLFWKAKGVLMLRNSLTADEAQLAILKRLPSKFHSFKEKMKVEKELALKIIKNDLGNYVVLSVNSLKSILLGIGLDSQARYYGAETNAKGRNKLTKKKTILSMYKPWFLLLIAYSSAFMLLVYLFATYGFISSFNLCTANKMINYLMLAIIVYFVLISSGHISAYSRMRVPIIPIFILYASYGIYLFSSRHLFKKKSLIVSVH